MSKAWYATSKKNLNKTHVCRWTVPDKSASKGNRQHDESFATRDEAYRAVFAMQERIASGEFDAKQYTFGEAAYHWLDTRNLKPITRDSYRRHIKNVLTDYLDLPLGDVAQMQSTFYEWRTKGTGPRCFKLPNGQLRVRRADLESWLDAREDAA